MDVFQKKHKQGYKCIDCKKTVDNGYRCRNKDCEELVCEDYHKECRKCGDKICQTCTGDEIQSCDRCLS